MRPKIMFIYITETDRVELSTEATWIWDIAKVFRRFLLACSFHENNVNDIINPEVENYEYGENNDS